MSTRGDDRTGRVLDEVFEAEGRSRAPDRMLEEVFGRTRSTRQAIRRPWDALSLPTLPGRAGPLVVVALVLTAVAVATGAGGRFLAGPDLRPSIPPTATPVPSPAAVVCANASGLAGVAPNLWVRCPTGSRPIDTSGVTPTLGRLLDGVGVPVIGKAGWWSLAAGGIAELDPTGGTPRPLAVPNASVVAAGLDSVWVGTRDDTLLGLDPVTGATTRTVQLAAAPISIVEAGGQVWVAGDDGRLRAFDAASLVPGVTVEVGRHAARLAANDAAVFVLNQDEAGTVTRVDLSSGAVTSRTLAEPTDPTSLGELLVGDDALWVTRRTDILRLDPTTLEPGPPARLPSYPAGIVRDGAAAWVLGDARIDLVLLP